MPTSPAVLGTLDASSLTVADDCPSTLVRSREVEYFRKDHGLSPRPEAVVPAGGPEERSARLRALISKVPFHSERWGIGRPFNLSRWIDANARRIGLELVPGDAWFIADTVRKRDAMIDRLIAVAGADAKVELGLSGERMRARFIDGEVAADVEGVADIIVFASGKNGTHVLVADYGTGYLGKDAEGAAESRRLRILAALAQANNPSPLAGVVVALLQRNDMPAGEIDGASFGPDLLNEAMEWLRIRAVDQAVWLAGYEKAREPDGTPLENFGNAVDAAARPGSHCDQCAGRVACQKLQRSVDAELVALPADTQAIVKAVRAWIKSASGDIEDPKFEYTPDPMKLETLSAALAWSERVTDAAAPASKVWKEAGDLVRDIHAASVRKPSPVANAAGPGRAGAGVAPGAGMSPGLLPPGWGLKDGAEHFKFRTAMPATDADGKAVVSGNGEKALIPFEAKPAEVFSLLRSVLPPTMTLDDFVQATCGVDAKAVQAILADQHRVDPREVFTKVLVPLGEVNPVEMRANAPTVIRSSAPQQNAAAVSDSAAVLRKAVGLPAVPASAPDLPDGGKSKGRHR